MHGDIHWPLYKYVPFIQVLHWDVDAQVKHDVGHWLQSVLLVRKVFVGHCGRHWWVAILW